MGKLTQIEKGSFLKLFNRGGYVLNFPTSDFDIFTLESVGIALCDKYKLSKGKSLLSFMSEAPEDSVIKLLKDLLDYYELNYEYEIENDKENAVLYKRCKDIMDRILLNGVPFAPSAESLKEKFSSDYISAQIDLMLKLQKENPTETIGKAKEFVESCCKTILEEISVPYDKKWDISQLTDATIKNLKLTPKDIPDTAPEATAIRAILGNLRAIAMNIATIRNAYGSGHGKSASYQGLEERHAKLAVGSSITLVNFLWDSHERQMKI
jgi:hypothetical protein